MQPNLLKEQEGILVRVCEKSMEEQWLLVKAHQVTPEYPEDRSVSLECVLMGQFENDSCGPHACQMSSSPILAGKQRTALE